MASNRKRQQLRWSGADHVRTPVRLGGPSPELSAELVRSSRKARRAAAREAARAARRDAALSVEGDAVPTA